MQTAAEEMRVTLETPQGDSIDITGAFGRGAKRAKAEAKSAGDGGIDLEAIKTRRPELVALYLRKQDAAASYRDAIDSVAGKAGISKQALNAYIAAVAKDKAPEAHKVVTQLELLFESV